MSKEIFVQQLRQIGVDKDFWFAFEKEFDEIPSYLKKLEDMLNSLLKQEYRVLTVAGTQGIGKTFTVAKCVEQYLKEQFLSRGDILGMAKFVSHFELDLSFKECMNSRASKTQTRVYEEFCNYPILIIDEVGRGSWTEYSANFIENIISKRYANKRTTVLISNKTPQELATMFDRNIVDRLSNGTTGKIWTMKGDSLR